MVKLRSLNGPPTVARYAPNYTASTYELHQIRQQKDILLPNHRSVLDGVFAYWNRLVEDFSDRDLTYPLDRLPATHGLAQALHKSHIQGGSFLQEYGDGHWMQNLHRSLIWYALSPRTTPETLTPTVPSWPWALHNGPIRFLPNVRKTRRRFSQDSRSGGTNSIIHHLYYQKFRIDLLIGMAYDRAEQYITKPPFLSLPEPLHTLSSNFQEVFGFVRSAKLDPNIKDETDRPPIAGGMRLRNSLGVPIANVMLDRSLQSDHTITDYLSISENTIYCLRTAVEENPDDFPMQQGTSESLRDNLVSVSIDGLILVPLR